MVSRIWICRGCGERMNAALSRVHAGEKAEVICPKCGRNMVPLSGGSYVPGTARVSQGQGDTMGPCDCNQKKQ